METVIAANLTLVNVLGLSIDQSLPKEQKLLEAVRRTGSPYRFKCGKFSITARFDKNAPSLESNMRRLLT